MATKQKLSTNSRPDVRKIQALSVAALNKALKPYGLVAKDSGGSISSISAKLKFEISPVRTAAQAKKVTMLAAYGDFHGLTVKDIGKTFVSGTRKFTFTDIVPRRHKYPINGTEVSTGKSFKFPLSVIPRINPKLPAVPVFGRDSLSF